MNEVTRLNQSRRRKRVSTNVEMNTKLIIDFCFSLELRDGLSIDVVQRSSPHAELHRETGVTIAVSLRHAHHGSLQVSCFSMEDGPRSWWKKHVARPVSHSLPLT